MTTRPTPLLWLAGESVGAEHLVPATVATSITSPQVIADISNALGGNPYAVKPR